MKNILYILLTLSILSTGCSKEDDVQITQEVTNNLDENLYGEWILSGSSSNHRSFSSNGKWGYWDTSGGVPIDETSGDWWVENDQVFCQYNGLYNTVIMNYSVSGNTLTLNDGTWIKQ